AAGRVAGLGAVAALSTPPDMGWFPGANAGQGRPDLTRDVLVRRRDAFLRGGHPAMTRAKASIASWLPWAAASSGWGSGGGGCGATLGVPKGVVHPLGGDEVLVVAGVADQRPAGPVRLAEVVGDGGADEAGLAGGGPDPLGEVRRHLQHGQVVALDVVPVGLQLGVPPAADAHREVRVCRRG